VYYDVGDPEETKKRGIIEVDEATGRVLKLLEKPDPSETTSRKACPAFYAYRNSTLPLVREFIEEHKHLPLEERDAPGKLLAWLIPRTPIQAIHVTGRFDIGNLTQYKDTLAHFSMVLDQQLRYGGRRAICSAGLWGSERGCLCYGTQGPSGRGG
jgi:UTP-glucose-1-phosphate uridylyltransferase